LTALATRRYLGHALGLLSLLSSILIWVEMTLPTSWAEKYLTDAVFATWFFGSLVLSLLAGLMSSRFWLFVMIIPLGTWAYIICRGH
jgi:membrane protein YqaA with SNARE-associated domain